MSDMRDGAGHSADEIRPNDTEDNSDVTGRNDVSGNGSGQGGDVIARPVLHRLLRRIIVGSAIALVCVCVTGLVSGWAHDGIAGMHAAIIGSIIVLLFSGTTPVTFAVLSRKRLSMKQFVSAVLVSWIVKIIIVFGALIALRGATWFNHHVFALVIFAGTIAVLIVEWVCVFASEFAAAGLRS